MKLSAFLVLAVATATTEAFVSRNIERTPTLSLQATKNHDRESENATTFANVALASIFSLSLLSAGPLPAFADGQTEKFKLPPVDLTDKTRCTLKSSSIGQANAARDKLYDLRQCKLSGESAVGFDLSGVIMTETDVSKVNFQDAVFSKGYLRGTTTKGTGCIKTTIKSAFDLCFYHVRLIFCSHRCTFSLHRLQLRGRRFFECHRRPSELQR